MARTPDSRAGLLDRLLAGPTVVRDRIYLVVLVCVPVVINVPFAIAGTPLLDGDNLVQNFPLRVLSGELLAHGRLPLWDPYIWSGTPLLAGWNAGAMFPGTWLFAFLPGVLAWEVNVIAVGVIAGVGLYFFLRRCGCLPTGSVLGALLFAYTGFMSGQTGHLGLVMGTAFAPWLLIALDAIANARRPSARGLGVSLFGTAGALAILAGDPRAISSDAVIAGVYLLARCWRLYRGNQATVTRLATLIGATAFGAVLSLAISAVQWLPGLTFLHTSQRASGDLAYFGAYSLTGGQLSYLFVPFLYGGNGSLGLPTTAFNLPEYTYSVGILPLVALFVFATRALLRSSGRGRRATEEAAPVGVYLVLVVVGVLLALGSNTPLSHLLVHIPLYGGERLQNRNMAITDLALCVLVAIFIDSLAPSNRSDRSTSRRRSPAAERLAGAIPPLVVVALIVAILGATSQTERFLGATTRALGIPERMAPYYAFEVAAAIVALAVAVGPSWLSSLGRHRLAVGVVVADLAMFVAMASYQPAPTSALAASNPIADALRPIAGASGRVAIFNPQQLPVRSPADALDDLGVDDLVVLHHLVSVQGYGSAVAADYETATGAHEVENLRPSALLSTTFDNLDLRVFATLPELFGSVVKGPGELALARGAPAQPGSSPADRQPGDDVQFGSLPPAGPWYLRDAPTFMLPGPLDVTEIALRVRSALEKDASVDVSVTLRSGAHRDFPVKGGAELVIARLPQAWVVAGGGAVAVVASTRTDRRTGAVLEALAVRAQPWSGDVPIETVAAIRTSGWLELDGMLQGLIEPTAWQYAARQGSLVFFSNRRASDPARLEPRSAGTVTVVSRAVWQDPETIADLEEPALLVRSETFAPGWSATITPLRADAGEAGERSRVVQVRPVGLLQGVELPAGRWQVTWHYRSADADRGLVAGLAGVVVVVALVLCARRRRRREASTVA